jgi:hypothetical protein
MKRTAILIIIGMVASLIWGSAVFAQPYSATVLPEASDPKPTSNADDQGQNNNDQGKVDNTDASDGVALILSSPLPSFRAQS